MLLASRRSLGLGIHSREWRYCEGRPYATRTTVSRPFRSQKSSLVLPMALSNDWYASRKFESMNVLYIRNGSWQAADTCFTICVNATGRSKQACTAGSRCGLQILDRFPGYYIISHAGASLAGQPITQAPELISGREVGTTWEETALLALLEYVV